MADSESTLSNITSIQSQLQSLYETCPEPMKIYQSLQNTATSDKVSNLQKALDKHTHLLQDLQQQQRSIAATINLSQPATYVVSSGGGGGGGVVATGSGKTATILVSKSKTKTGLPLLLKNSINN
uniref:Uncharacterized protein n=1 Tax=Stomoxys calcitrans TaxID=35570 RepID=A0A1I8P213_STOCA|nr:unnamed protein product [Stomoxys calcitrans]